ncbi:MAG: YqaE/Pmp3 family membrane protein [Chloroflexi bacterium]|nr:YqaE/Pmp3 family membrane protein [Chloroflexota bacterium]MBA2488940.1 YqaE/Pmp3 family membrane protein [Chloroflexota bacterium]
MKYVLAVLLPPVGLAMVGRQGQAIANLILWITVIGWPLAALWALLVVHGAETEERVRRILEEERRHR